MSLHIFDHAIWNNKLKTTLWWVFREGILQKYNKNISICSKNIKYLVKCGVRAVEKKTCVVHMAEIL